MGLILEVNDLLDITSTTATPPADPTLLAAHKKKGRECQEVYSRCNEGPYNPSPVGEEECQGDVGCSD